MHTRARAADDPSPRLRLLLLLLLLLTFALPSKSGAAATVAVTALLLLPMSRVVVCLLAGGDVFVAVVVKAPEGCKHASAHATSTALGPLHMHIFIFGAWP